MLPFLLCIRYRPSLWRQLVLHSLVLWSRLRAACFDQFSSKLVIYSKKRWRNVYFGRSRNFLNRCIPFDRLIKSRKRSGRHKDGASKVSVNGAYTTKHFNVVVACTLYRCMEVWIREGRGVYTVKLRFRMVFEIFWEMFLWKMNFSIL